MPEHGQGIRWGDGSVPEAMMSAAELKAEANARREEEAAAQAIRTCQDPNLLMFLEGLGTDAVAFALDVSIEAPLIRC